MNTFGSFVRSLRHIAPRFALLLALSALLVCGSGSVRAQQWSSATSVDTRWQRTVSAGPYSVVDTVTGLLITTLPLNRVRGPGGTVLDFTLTHLSVPNTPDVVGQIANGWRHSYDEWVTNVPTPGGTPGNQSLNDTETQRSYPGGHLDHWAAATPDPGVRDALGFPANNGAGYATTSKYGVVTNYQQNRGAGEYSLTSVVDTHNNTISVSYDAQQHVQTVTDASGQRTLNFTWDPNNIYIAKSMDLSGEAGDLIDSTVNRIWTFWPDPNNPNRLGSIILPTVDIYYGSGIGFTYLADGTIRTITDPNGNTWTYDYYPGTGQVHHVYRPGSSTAYATFTYAPNTPIAGEETTTIADEVGHTTTHIYDTNGTQYINNMILQVIDPKVSRDPAAFSCSFSWNTNDDTIHQVTDRRGKVWTFQWDSNNSGDLLQQTNPLSQTTSYLYTSQHQVMWVKDARGNRALYSYFSNTNDLQTVVVDPKTDPNDLSYHNPSGLAITTNYTYDGQGNLASVKVGSDNPTTFTDFDSFGNPHTITNPLHKVWTAQYYDNFGMLGAWTDPYGNSISFNYDEWMRVTDIGYPSSSGEQSEHFQYDYNNNVTEVDVGGSPQTYHHYDSQNRLYETDQLAVANAQPPTWYTTTYDHDTVSNLYHIGHTSNIPGDTSGPDAHYSYDERGLLIFAQYNGGASRTYHHDGSGHVDDSLDSYGSQRETQLSYDDAGRLIQLHYPASSGQDVTYSYYPNGLRQSMTDHTGLYQWSYNSANLPVTYQQPNTAYPLNYTYDSHGRRATMALSGQTWTYVYNPDDTLQQLKETGVHNVTANFDYYDNGLLMDKMIPTDNNSYTETDYNYDSMGRLTYLWHKYPGHTGNPPVGYQTYSYDSVGNLSVYDNIFPDVINANNQPNEWVTNYTYDNLHRLKEETRTGVNGTTAADDEDIKYDLLSSGDRNMVTRTFQNSQSQSTYQYDSNHRLLSGDGYNFSGYDGNDEPHSWMTLLLGSMTLSYDYRERLSQIVYPGNTFDLYYYNGDDLRVTRQDRSRTVRQFIYDGSTCIAEAETNGGRIVAYYTPGIGTLYPLSNQQSYFDANLQGSTEGLTDQNGARIDQVLYDAFGVPTALGGTQSSALAFGGANGYYTDPDSFLVLTGQRYYLPGLGRYLTEDPIGQSGGLNEWVYAGNSPVTNLDPSGLVSIGTSHLGIVPDGDGGAGSSGSLADRFINGVSNASSGIADTLTFGATDKIRDWMGTNQYVDKGSGAYIIAQIATTGVQAVVTDGASEFAEAGEAAAEAEEALQAERTAEEALTTGCFVADTPVTLADGSSQPIQQVQAGDTVATCDPQTGQTEAKTVARTMRHTAYQTVTVQLADTAGHIVETLTGTPEHPFFVLGQGLVPMGALGIGTQVVTRAGPALVVASVRWQNHPQGVAVYNLEVTGDHTYFVGTANGGVWVHNDCGEIALGRDPYFKDLADQTGAAGYRQWAERGITRRTVDNNFGRAFHQAADRSSAIHFALDDIEDVGEAVRLGARGFRGGNITNAELHYIVNNPALLAKTIFYRGGSVIARGLLP